MPLGSAARKLKCVADGLALGRASLPIRPAHRDGLVTWILKVQAVAPAEAKVAAGLVSELERLIGRARWRRQLE